MEKKHALAGIKIVDFTTTAVGPSAVRFMADHGAEVIRIESSTHPCILRTAPPYKDGIPGINRSGYFAYYNAGKYSMALNLKKPGGIETARKVIRWADVVVESFTPGVMKRWGLDYETLKQIQPDIIMVSTTQLGQWGPHCQFRGYGNQGAGVGGWGPTTGWPDRAPVSPFSAYTDFVAHRYVLIAILSALAYRRKTGKGQYIDNSQAECALEFMAPSILDYTVNGRLMVPQGNRDPYAAPHGAYRCYGEDKWCVIAITDDDKWKAFAGTIGNPSWTEDDRFSSLAGRKENEDELDRLVEAWTVNHSPESVTAELQKAKVPAGTVQTAEDLFCDPQFKYRGQFKVLNHPEIGPHAYGSPGFRLSKTPGGPQRPAPCMGEHNEYICTRILGMSDTEFLEIMEAGAFE